VSRPAQCPARAMARRKTLEVKKTTTEGSLNRKGSRGGQATPVQDMGRRTKDHNSFGSERRGRTPVARKKKRNQEGKVLRGFGKGKRRSLRGLPKRLRERELG